MGKTEKITVYLLTILVYGFFRTPCFAYDDEGFQFWSTASASFDINKDWKGKFEEEFRCGDDGGYLYYQHSDLGFVYAGLADWIDVGFNFRYVLKRETAKTNGGRKTGHILILH